MGGSRVRTRSRPSAGQRILGGFGEILITLGLVLLLFVAWELWWTNIDADKAQAEVTQELVQEFASGTSAKPGKPGGPSDAGILIEGETFGIMYVPRFGKDNAHPVTHGVGPEVLDNVGIGHYPDTQMPGEIGNFAVAAHRQTHGQVFWDIDKLVDGDKIYVQTRDGFFTYAYKRTIIVDPSRGDVLYPVPMEPGVKPTVATLTLTSCHPPFTTRERIIAFAELESKTPADAEPPAEIAGTVAKLFKDTKEGSK